MRIGIYTNRLPYPPIGGIPKFLHELSQTFIALGLEVEFFLPNLSTKNIEVPFSKNSQSFIETNLSKKNGSFSGGILELLSQDVTLSLLNWLDKGPYSEQHMHPLLDENINNITELIGSFDFIIIAGSSLLLFNKSPVLEVISKSSVPTIFVLLFPLREIEFYLGYLGRCLVA